MSEHHRVWISSSGSDSFALLSDDLETDNALIFVHGFGGDPDRTWRHLQTLIHDEPGFGTCDLYFWGYRSIRDRIVRSAQRLGDFVDLVYPLPPQELFFVSPVEFLATTGIAADKPVGFREDVKPYRSLTLVGHSSGGLVLRQTVLEFAKSSHPALGAALRLFAPAIMGATPAGLLGMALGSRPGALTLSWLNGSGAYRDMTASNLMLTIQNQTETLAADPNPHPALCALIVWPDFDSVVTPGEYSCDVRRDFVSGVTHATICKPTVDYRLPIDFVLNDIPT